MTCAPRMRGGSEGVAGHLTSGTIVVGVLSDTHGDLYPEVVRALTGVDHIVHAGDVGSAQVLARLKKLAPVTAVKGNCDVDAWAAGLPSTAELDIGGVHIVVEHVATRLPRRGEVPVTVPEGSRTIVIYGHTHMAALERRNGVLLLNPGSAGPVRFGRPRSIARLTISPAGRDGLDDPPRIDVEIITVSS